MPSVVTITVSVPGGPSASWEAMSRRSAIRQAKFEAERGARVEVVENGEVIFTNRNEKPEWHKGQIP